MGGMAWLCAASSEASVFLSNLYISNSILAYALNFGRLIGGFTYAWLISFY